MSVSYEDFRTNNKFTHTGDDTRSRSGAARRCRLASAAGLRVGRRRANERCGLVDEEVGNLVLDGVSQLAGVAAERGLVGQQFEGSCAFGTCENVDQRLVERHVLFIALAKIAWGVTRRHGPASVGSGHGNYGERGHAVMERARVDEHRCESGQRLRATARVVS